MTLIFEDGSLWTMIRTGRDIAYWGEDKVVEHYVSLYSALVDLRRDHGRIVDWEIVER